MALALTLGEHDTPPERLVVTSEVTFDAIDGVPTITTSRISVRAQVPGVDATTFASMVDEAAQLCPVSRLFTGAKITVDATLEEG
jgi:osmotically inducible protein OsmC